LQYASDKLREFAIAEDGCFAELVNVQLIEDFARCGERLNENGLFIADGIGKWVEIFEREGQVFGKGTVVIEDAEHGAPGAMSLEAAPTKRADGPQPVGGARDVDFSCDPATDPARSLVRGDTADFGNLADEFMAGSAAKRVVSAQNFEVGIADSGKTYANQSPARPQLRQRLRDRFQFSVGDLKGPHRFSCSESNRQR
jgi:hypothetical protein